MRSWHQTAQSTQTLIVSLYENIEFEAVPGYMAMYPDAMYSLEWGNAGEMQLPSGLADASGMPGSHGKVKQRVFMERLRYLCFDIICVTTKASLRIPLLKSVLQAFYTYPPPQGFRHYQILRSDTFGLQSILSLTYGSRRCNS